MIHKLLNLTRPLIVPDCETTGVDTQNDRIVEIGFQVWTAAGLEKEWRTLVDPGIPIPPQSIETHGITDAKVLACKTCETGKYGHDGSDHDFRPHPKFSDLAANLAKGFSDCDFAGKNVRFDLRIIAAEMGRCNAPWSLVGARIIDADRLEQIAVPRTLSDLYRKYCGEDLKDAHEALADVRATTTKVIEQQLSRYEILPKDLDSLHRLQFPGMIDLEGKFRFVEGVPCFTQWGKYANKPMTMADTGYWDFILAKDFSADVKALARDAKIKKYPKESR